MKFCPVCQTQYDEEILRFCIKDGTPLIDDAKPDFKEMPSESAAEAEDLGEDTIIRRKPTKDELDALKTPEKSEPARIVIPTAEQERQQVRSKTVGYQSPPQKSNTPMVVLTTVVLTLVGLASLVGVWYMLGNGNDSNTNVNVNTNLPNGMNLNTNFGLNIPPSNFDYNNNISSNFNNLNLNVNTNFNTNTKSPTPTKSPSPSPSTSPSPSPSPTSTVNTTPSPTGTPKPGTPIPTKTPTPTPPPNN